MPYDEGVAERVRAVLAPLPDIDELRMMGGLVFTLRGHMCCGVSDDGLMVRVGPDAQAKALREPHVGPLDIGGGRNPRAFLRVAPEGFESDDDLTRWVSRGLMFANTLPEKAPH